jgi:hypothetical protein
MIIFDSVTSFIYKQFSRARRCLIHQFLINYVLQSLKGAVVGIL